MKKYLLFSLLILMPLTLFAQRKYPIGITPYILERMHYYIEFSNQPEKTESLLRSLGYKFTSYQKDDDSLPFSTTTYTRKTKDGYGSEIYLSTGTGLCHFISVKFFTSKGSNCFINLLRKSKYKLHYDYGEKIWYQPNSDDEESGFRQKGRLFSIIYGCA